MTTPCHAVDCTRPADFMVGSRTPLCAFHYKQEPGTPCRHAVEVAR